MHPFIRRCLGSARSGQSVVELALVLPVLIYLAVGGADFARALTQYIQVVNAASAGAQYASLSSADSTNCTQITSTADADLTGVSSPTVTCGTPVDDGTSESQKEVTITVSTSFHTITPLVGLFAHAITISSSATMRVNANGG